MGKNFKLVENGPSWNRLRNNKFPLKQLKNYPEFIIKMLQGLL